MSHFDFCPIGEDLGSSSYLKNATFWKNSLGTASLVLLPNVAFLLVERHIGAGRPLFNIDYLLAVAVGLAVSRGLSVIFLFAIYSAECARIFVNIYFYGMRDIGGLLPYTLDINRLLLFRVSASLFIFFGLSAYLWLRILPPKAKHGRWKSLLPVLLFLGICYANDAIPPLNALIHKNLGHHGSHLLCEYLLISTDEISPLRHVQLRATSAATDIIRNQLNTTGVLKSNIVLVLVESMGLPKNQHMLQTEFSIFQRQSLTKRYAIKEGSVPFSGGTVPGELRELCGVITGINIEQPELSEAEKCLPKQLNHLGFQTESLHGFRGTFFHRNIWHPGIGFGRSLFMEQLFPTQGMFLCDGAFLGICDSDMAHLIDTQLRDLRNTKNRIFIHWVSLNSHLPINDAAAPPFKCLPAYQGTICNQIGYIGKVLQDIRDIADDPLIPSTIFIIVGDHPPPYTDAADRGLYDSQRVPFVILKPKS